MRLLNLNFELYLYFRLFNAHTTSAKNLWTSIFPNNWELICLPANFGILETLQQNTLYPLTIFFTSGIIVRNSNVASDYQLQNIFIKGFRMQNSHTTARFILFQQRQHTTTVAHTHTPTWKRIPGWVYMQVMHSTALKQYFHICYDVLLVLSKMFLNASRTC